jgi:hypothetical protein
VPCTGQSIRLPPVAPYPLRLWNHSVFRDLQPRIPIFSAFPPEVGVLNSSPSLCAITCALGEIAMRRIADIGISGLHNIHVCTRKHLGWLSLHDQPLVFHTCIAKGLRCLNLRKVPSQIHKCHTWVTSSPTPAIGVAASNAGCRPRHGRAWLRHRCCTAFGIELKSMLVFDIQD